ncbi:MAG: DUF2202 domain-containing protein [Mameliella sp.]|nr:DUF2202 domain-containing protein [Phaeodactylibacter sp.]
MRKVLILLVTLMSVQIGSTQVQLVLNQQEKNTLIKIAEGEKLAQDVYFDMADLWEAQSFVHFAVAEQQQLSIIQQIAERYNIELPKAVRSAQHGIFDNPEMQEYYISFIQKGQQSLTNANQVGVLIEEMDINALKEAINTTNNPGLKATYSLLLEVSNDHLAQFYYDLDNGGSAYIPDFTTTADFNAIMRDDESSIPSSIQLRLCLYNKLHAETGSKDNLEKVVLKQYPPNPETYPYKKPSL